MKRFFTIFAILALLCCFAFCAFAAHGGGLAAVSYRGDTGAAPANSLRAIEAAFDAGADWVSVSVRQTKDGAFVLLEDALLSAQCETDLSDPADCGLAQLQTLHYRNADGTVSTETVTTLDQALVAAVGKGGLILDNAWDWRDALNAMIGSRSLAVPVCLRTFDSAKKALQWSSGADCVLRVLPVYDGNVVFNAIGHWNRLSAENQPLVQFQSKNYFNVFYQKFTAKRFHTAAATSALAPAYDKNLCGKRSDDVTGWDDLISCGFSAIETGNIRGLTAYIAQCEREREALKTLTQQAIKAENGAYSSVSAARFSKANDEANAVLPDRRASLSQLQSARSDLQNALRLLAPKGDADTQPGTFRVTPGRIAVIVIFGALLLGFDIFVYRKKKKV